MGICLSCLRPQEDEDPNSETQPLLQNEQLLQQKQRDLIAREEQYRQDRILQLEKLINQTRDVLIDSNNLYLEQSYSSLSNGNLPKVVKRITNVDELDDGDGDDDDGLVEKDTVIIKNDVGSLFMDIDKTLTVV